MLAQQRHQVITQLLNQIGGVKVTDLSRELEVSEMTIRRDLQYLEEKGRLIRIHGGAITIDIQNEPDFAEKEDLLAAEKSRIAKGAIKLVMESRPKVVGLSAGTTTTAIAKLLPREIQLTVVTNAINIAYLLASSNINVVVTGGTMRSKSFALVGPEAVTSLEKLNLDILFLGANGVSIHGGITTSNLREAQVNSKFLAQTSKAIVVADHTKLGRTALGKIADLTQVDLLLTSRGASDKFVDDAQNMGLMTRKV